MNRFLRILCSEKLLMIAAFSVFHMIHASHWKGPTERVETVRPRNYDRGVKTTPKYRTYKISVRNQDTNKLLSGIDTKGFLKKRPWAEFRPSPFVYGEDVLAHKKSNLPKDIPPFVVGGLNCNKTLEKVPTITGVPVKHLQLRAKADPKKAQFANRKGPEWKGSNNVYMRSSGDGFIRKGQSLRRLLVSDNNIAKKLGLTHQMIAEPMLIGIRAYQRACQKNPPAPKTVQFKYQGSSYKISLQQMGGAVGLRPLEPTKKQIRMGACYQFPGGWTGVGVQGSIFSDELFSSSVFTITNPKGQKLTKDSLTPHLIYRYGFYQGGDYRIDPDEVVRFFGISRPKTNPWANCEQ